MTSMTENLSDVSEQYSQFLSSYGGFNVARMTNSASRWFQRVQICHETVRNLFGGILVSIDIEIESEDGIANVKSSKFKEAIQLLNAGCTRDSELIIDFGSSSLKDIVRSRFFRESDGERLLNHKHISTTNYLYQRFRDVWGVDRKKINERSISDFDGGMMLLERALTFDRGISLLGDAWASSKTQAGKYRSIFDTTCESFWKLGHYGPDNESCFKQTGQRGDHKYILGQSENSFVIKIISTDKDTDGMFMGRAWAFLELDKANDKLVAIHVFNPYLDKKFSYGNFIKAVQISVESIFPKSKFGKYDVIDEQCSIMGKNVYTNKNRFSLVFKPDECKFTSHATSHFRLPGEKSILCGRCGREQTEKANLYDVDDLKVCVDCASMSSQDLYHRCRTFRPLVVVWTKNSYGEMRKTNCSSDRLEDFWKCGSGVYYHNQIKSKTCITSIGTTSNPKITRAFVPEHEWPAYNLCEETGEYVHALISMEKYMEIVGAKKTKKKTRPKAAVYTPYDEGMRWTMTFDDRPLVDD